MPASAVSRSVSISSACIEKAIGLLIDTGAVEVDNPPCSP
jgi:hypothetical protein